MKLGLLVALPRFAVCVANHLRVHLAEMGVKDYDADSSARSFIQIGYTAALVEFPKEIKLGML